MPDSLPPFHSSLSDLPGLAAAGLVPVADLPLLEEVASRYAMLIPPVLLGLIGDADDPIGRQFVPHPDEAVIATWESEDPVGDDALSPLAGIVHRYPDRVLLKPLLVCPTYCRFCFRRAHVGPDGGMLSAAQLEAALEWIAARPGVREVILTGGDPLLLSARRLGDILERLDGMPQLEQVRVHTRVPIARPDLVTEALADVLDRRLPVFVVVHANHAREFSGDAGAALERLRRAGVPLLGQSVLLRGVNDSEDALAALFRAMLRHRVKPYYLHQLDAAEGTARFHVPVEEGQRLLGALRGKISGLALPIYVLDKPTGKLAIAPSGSIAGPGALPPHASSNGGPGQSPGLSFPSDQG